jgi:hypothetical protein
LFSDSSHELVTSLLPTFLTVSLHAGPAALGVIEGTSDALTGFSKLIGGPLANDPRRRGRSAAGGYLGTAVATAAIGLTTAVWQVAVLRAFAWVSRGIRSPPRDVQHRVPDQQPHLGGDAGRLILGCDWRGSRRRQLLLRRRLRRRWRRRSASPQERRVLSGRSPSTSHNALPLTRTIRMDAAVRTPSEAKH